MAGPPGCVMRRRLMLTALSGAAALALGTRGSCGAAQFGADQKMTQKQAEYQDEPKGGIMMCGTCTLFIPPAECKVVEG